MQSRPQPAMALYDFKNHRLSTQKKLHIEQQKAQKEEKDTKFLPLFCLKSPFVPFVVQSQVLLTP